MTPEQISSNYDYWIIVRRWAAFWLDCVFIIAVAVVLTLPDKFRVVMAPVCLLLVVLYYPLLEGLTGSSFGKWMCRLKVVNAEGHAPGIAKACIRTLLRLIEVNPLLFGGIPAGIVVATSGTRQRLGDKAANTFVLRCEDLELIGVPPAMPMPGIPDILAIPQIPGALPSPFMPGALKPNPSAITTYPGNIDSNTINPTVIWAAPGAIMLTVLTVVLIFAAFGIHDAAARDSHPMTMSCADFLKRPAKNGWYHLTGCEWDVSGSVWPIPAKKDPDEFDSEAQPSGIQEVYVPVFSREGTSKKSTGLVVQSADEAIRNTVTGLDGLKSDDAKTVRKWVAEHTDELTIHRDIDGTIQSEFEVPEAIRDKIVSSENSEVSAGFVVIKDGGAPTEFGTIGACVGALLTGAFAFIFWILVLVNVCQRGNARVRR